MIRQLVGFRSQASPKQPLAARSRAGSKPQLASDNAADVWTNHHFSCNISSHADHRLLESGQANPPRFAG